MKEHGGKCNVEIFISDSIIIFLLFKRFFVNILAQSEDTWVRLKRHHKMGPDASNLVTSKGAAKLDPLFQRPTSQQLDFLNYS
jgi:hypothetical protein